MILSFEELSLEEYASNGSSNMDQALNWNPYSHGHTHQIIELCYPDYYLFLSDSRNKAYVLPTVVYWNNNVWMSQNPTVNPYKDQYLTNEHLPSGTQVTSSKYTNNPASNTFRFFFFFYLYTV